jgi:outer membrane protein assembly factor BamB
MTKAHPIKLPLAVGVLCVLFGHPAALLAWGAGCEYFLLSHDGKLIRKLDTTRWDFVDTVRELIYQRSDTTFTVRRFTGAKRFSPIPIHVDKEWYGTEVEWRGTGGLLALLSNKHVLGVERITGKEVYRKPLEDFVVALSPYPKSDFWDVETNREFSHFRYLLNSKQDTSVPPILAKLDLRTGKLLWKRTIPPRNKQNLVVQTVARGVVEGEKWSFYFDPDTGEPLTKVPTSPEAMRQIFFGEDTVYHLSAEKAATLTAYQPGTWKKRWSIGGLQGVRKMLGPYVHDRLLLATTTELVVIDTKRKQVLSRFAAPELQSDNPDEAARLLALQQTEKLLLLCDAKQVRAVELVSGKTIWQRKVKCTWESFTGRLTLALCPENQLVVVEAGKGIYEENVLALSLKDGSVRWRWVTPGAALGDTVWSRVLPCPSGLLVERNWIILR